MPEAPAFVQIEPVGQCNLRCQMCAIQFRRDGPPTGPPAFMDFDLFRDIVSEIEPGAGLHLQGLGEPMMHPRFFEMVRCGVEKGLHVSTNSNLTLLNERKARELVCSGMEVLHVSIDGAEAATYERIRARGHFDRVVRNVRLVRDARERAPASQLRMKMIVVGMRQNLAELPALVRLGASLGFEEVFVQHLAHDFGEDSLPEQYGPMRSFVDEQTLLCFDEDQVGRAFDRAREAAGEVGIGLRLPRLRPKVHSPSTPGPERCDWPWRGAYISYDGQAMPCCMVGTPDRVSFGTLNGRGLLGTWHGSDYESFRSRLASPRPPSVCASCSIYRGTF